MKPISVIIADSQYLVRVGFQHLLNQTQHIKLLDEAPTEKELLEKLTTTKVDVVVIDYNQADSFSKETIQVLRTQYPEIGILVISADNEKDSIYKVLEAGVSCFITKSCNESEILQGIQAAAKEQRFFCKKVIDYVFERSFAKSPEETVLPLTNREIEIVQLVASGLIAKEIADKLKLSPHTIYTHRKNIMRKLKLGTASELVLYAVNNGLVK